VGHAVDTALVECIGCAFVQMNAAMPQTISTNRVKAALGFAQCGQVLQ